MEEYPPACLRVVLDLYAAIDAGRARAAAGSFTTDAVFETSTMRAEGLEAVTKFLAAREDDADRRTLHVLSNVRGSTSSHTSAEVAGVLFLYTPDEDGAVSPWVLKHAAPARHLLRRVDGRWLIAARMPGEVGG